MTRRIALTAALVLAIWLLPAHSTTQSVDWRPWAMATYILDENVDLAQPALAQVWGPTDQQMWASIDAWYPPGADGHHVLVGWAGKCGAPVWGTYFYADPQAYEIQALIDGLPAYVYVDERRDRPDVFSAFTPHCQAYWGAPMDAQPGYVVRVDLRQHCSISGRVCPVKVRLWNRIGQVAYSNQVSIPIP